MALLNMHGQVSAVKGVAALCKMRQKMSPGRVGRSVIFSNKWRDAVL